MKCLMCNQDLVQVDNPFRTEFRHKRGTSCAGVIDAPPFLPIFESATKSGIPRPLSDNVGIAGNFEQSFPFFDYPRLWDSEPNGVTHIAGGALVICGRYMRQRCEWCGIILIEYDLKRTAVHPPTLSEPPALPAHWPPGKLVRVDKHISAVIEDPAVIDEEVQLPPDCCAFDPKTQMN